MSERDIYRTLQGVSVIEIGIELLGDRMWKQTNGSHYKGLCPFHEEKHPSFYLKSGWNWFVCYGCGKTGGPIILASELMDRNIRKALDYLVKKAELSIETKKLSDISLEVIYEWEQERKGFLL